MGGIVKLLFDLLFMAFQTDCDKVTGFGSGFFDGTSDRKEKHGKKDDDRPCRHADAIDKEPGGFLPNE